MLTDDELAAYRRETYGDPNGYWPCKGGMRLLQHIDGQVELMRKLEEVIATLKVEILDLQAKLKPVPQPAGPDTPCPSADELE
jgi:hypothetical protein